MKTGESVYCSSKAFFDGEITTKNTLSGGENIINIFQKKKKSPRGH